MPDVYLRSGEPSPNNVKLTDPTVGSGPPPSQVGSSLGLAWGDRNTVGASRSLSWRLKVNVGASRATSWRIRNTVTVSRSVSWRLRNLVGTSEGISWGDRNVAGSSRGTSWRIRGTVGSSRSLVYRVRSTAGGSRAVTYRIRATPVEATLVLFWRLGVARVIEGGPWHQRLRSPLVVPIRRTVGSSLELRWRIDRLARSVLTISWAVPTGQQTAVSARNRRVAVADLDEDLVLIEA